VNEEALARVGPQRQIKKIFHYEFAAICFGKMAILKELPPMLLKRTAIK
jgi:hypothetical protein